MKRNTIWILFCLLLTLLLVSNACATQTSTTNSTTAQKSVTTTSSQTQSKTTTTIATVSTSASTKPVSTVTESHWWDSDGTPQYGGSLIYTYSFIDVICDPANDPRPSQFGAHLEWLFCDNMLTDRNEYAFQANWVPLQYEQGWLAESWEQTDPLTITVHLCQGIHWQNKAPTNGREFTADDVVFAYNRALGTGSGFTEPNPFFAPNMALIDHVEAVDTYTVAIKLKGANPMAVYQVVEPSLRFGFTAPEWWALSDTEKQDFHYVTGTGAFVLSDFVSGTSITYDRNTEYWGYDEKYPENKLPYLDHWKVLAIPDMATEVAALRTAKVDMIVDGRSHVTAEQAESIKESNPEMKIVYWLSSAGSVTFRYGSKPFSDIKVRKAMQMCVDTDTLAKDYYKGLGDPTPPAMASSILGSDWSDPYESWPETLQQEYQYNIGEARNLMNEAGYPNGFETNMEASSQDDTMLAVVLKDYFKQIGINVTINSRDAVTAGVISRGNKYDQLLFGGGASLGSGPSDNITTYWSQKFERNGGVEDPAYDAIVENYFASTTMADCQKYFTQASSYAIEQHWNILLGTYKTAQVYQPWVKGWHGENFWSVPQWAYYARMWIDQSQKK